MDEYEKLKQKIEMKEKENEEIKKNLKDMKIRYSDNPSQSKRSQNISYQQNNPDDSIANQDSELEEYYKKYSFLYDKYDKQPSNEQIKSDMNSSYFQNTPNNPHKHFSDKGMNFMLSESDNHIRRNSKNFSEGHIPVVNNIKTNIDGIKSKLTNYEQVYDILNSKLDYEGQNKVKFLQSKIIQLEEKLKEESQMKEKIKENYQKIISKKDATFNIEIERLQSDFNEQFQLMKNKYEHEISEILKNHQIEKSRLNTKISELDKEITILKQKGNKKDISDYQKKYLTEMKDLQLTFEKFKTKAYEEFKILKKQRDEEKERNSQLMDTINQMKMENEMNESSLKETEMIFRSKTENIKQLIKANEILKIENSNNKKEIEYLKIQVQRNSENEKKLQNLILENDFINEKIEDLGLNLDLSRNLSRSHIADNEHNLPNNNTNNHTSNLIINRKLFASKILSNSPLTTTKAGNESFDKIKKDSYKSFNFTPIVSQKRSMFEKTGSSTPFDDLNDHEEYEEERRRYDSLNKTFSKQVKNDFNRDNRKVKRDKSSKLFPVLKLNERMRENATELPLQIKK